MVIGPSNDAPLNLPKVERPAEATDEEWVAGAHAAAYEMERAADERRKARMHASQVTKVMRHG